MKTMNSSVVNIESTNLARQLEEYFDRLWPINRSLMGPGYRSSLDILSEIMPHNVLKYKTGTKVFDWTVPKEWNLRDAYIIGPDGKKYCDCKENNLHILGYSVPYKGKVSLQELKKHLYSLPDQPEATPYVTSYYKERWGFCLPDQELKNLSDGEYDVLIDSELYPGHLDVGEAVLEGKSKEEILLTSYLCHPSLANNELSGPLVLVFLYDLLKNIPNRRYTYRFVLNPETLGSICYLAERGQHLKENLKAGYVITCVGKDAPFTYKCSKQENSLADRAARQVLKEYKSSKVISYNPVYSSDERQYCSPGFNLPVGSLMRVPYGEYYEYHTSLDNKDCISFSALAESVKVYSEVIYALESNVIWKNTVPFCDPCLGPRGLYPTLSTKQDYDKEFQAVFWLLSYADGMTDSLTIAEKSGLDPKTLMSVANRFAQAGLLKL